VDSDAVSVRLNASRHGPELTTLSTLGVLNLSTASRLDITVGLGLNTWIYFTIDGLDIPIRLDTTD
jgi:hypothetical protein